MIDAEAAVDQAMKIQGWKTLEELIWIARQAAKAEITIDVGCWRGRTTKAMAAVTQGVVIAIDHFASSYSGETARNEVRNTAAGLGGVIEDFHKNLKTEIDNGKVYAIFMDGSAAHDALLTVLQGEKADFVWIDGDHSYEDAKADILFYRSVIRAGGILSGHDYDPAVFPGVVRAVNELCPGFKLGHGTSWWVST